MALKRLGEAPVIVKSQHRIFFEDRLQAIADIVGPEHMRSKNMGVYTKWRFFASYLVIRTYNTHFKIMLWGDYDQHQVKKCSYKNVNLQEKGLKFIAKLLNDKYNNEQVADGL